MYFDLFVLAFDLATAIAAVLSMTSGTGACIRRAISVSISRIHCISCASVLASMYSAAHVIFTTVLRCLAVQDIEQSPR